MTRRTRTDPIGLSPRQAELLLFFAGRGGLTTYQVTWGTALDRLGLIERDDTTSRYHITDLGQQVAERLVPESNQAAAAITE